MLKIYFAKCADSMLLLVLLFLLLSNGQGQTYNEHACDVYEGNYCVKYNDCPTAYEIVLNRRAIPCGFENNVVKICCPLSKPPQSYTPTRSPITSSTTRATTRPTFSYTTSSTTQRTTTSRPTPTPTTSRPTATPTRLRPTPATPTTKPTPTPQTPKPPTRPTPPNTLLSSRNATATALSNCQKYGDFRYVKHHLEPLYPGDSATDYTVQDCVNVVTLIVGGTPTDPKEYPHMALIGYGSNFKNVDWACGGSLISDKFVLSAAHCGNTELGEAKWVLLGDLDISVTNDDAKPAVYSIVRRFDHPNYKPPSAYNDISVFQLNTSVEMGPYVRPACLHTSTSFPVGTKGSITGWGLTGVVERRSNHLLKATITVNDDELCRTSYDGSSRLDRGYEASTMVCAGDLITGKDTCPGDSGGPLQVLTGEACMWSIVGITSIGPGICGDMETPGIYTRVAHYLDWIQKIVWP